MYRFLSLTPERYDLPRRGENRDLDKRLAAFIERHLGPKVSFKTASAFLYQFLS